jgi:hypothetical protein
MVIAAGAIAAGGALASAGIGAAASGSAAGAQAGAAGNAAAQNLAEFQLNYNTQHPFVQFGQNASNSLADLINSGVMGQTPWQYGQAENALNRIPQTANLPGTPTLPGVPTFANANLPNAPNLPSAPPPMTQAQLEATPGYQFNLSQGLKATQSAAAAKGLGVSGAALKGASTYATGLADSTYQNQFNNAQQIYSDLFNNAQTGYTDAFNTGQQNYTDLFNNTQTQYQNQLNNVQQNYTNQFNLAQQGYLNAVNSANTQATGFMNLGQAQTNRLNQQYANLLGATSIGANSASGLGSQGVTSAQNQGNFITQGGNALASGAVGIGNALSGGISNGLNQYLGYNALQNSLQGANPAGVANTASQTPSYAASAVNDPTGLGYQPAYLSGGSIY